MTFLVDGAAHGGAWCAGRRAGRVEVTPILAVTALAVHAMPLARLASDHLPLRASLVRA